MRTPGVSVGREGELELENVGPTVRHPPLAGAGAGTGAGFKAGPGAGAGPMDLDGAMPGLVTPAGGLMTAPEPEPPTRRMVPSGSRTSTPFEPPPVTRMPGVTTVVWPKRRAIFASSSEEVFGGVADR